MFKQSTSPEPINLILLGLERDCEDLQGAGGETRADSGGERGRDWKTDARLFKIETQTQTQTQEEKEAEIGKQMLDFSRLKYKHV